MFPFPVRWDRIKEKEGDTVSIDITPVEKAFLLAVLTNAIFIGQSGGIVGAIEDSDNFDDVVSGLIGKVTL